jgi:Double sensory domain of two-component sensor kinase
MLLTRIWFVVLAVAATLGLSTALLARGMFNREEIADVDELLRRDRFAVESLLKLDARARIDALAPIAADGAVREGVRAKKDKALKDRLRTMNQQLEELRADMLIAVDADGSIVAQEGRSPARAGSGLGKIPLVERALAGFLGDDVWVYDEGVYRMAARPVVDRGVYVGAVIHGQKLDATLAQRLSERLSGASVGFFWSDRVVASFTPSDVKGAPTQTELMPALTTALTDERLKRGERTEPFELDGRGRAVFSLVAGAASSAGVGYAIARPYATLATPAAIFDRATKDDIKALPQPALGAALVGLVLIAMLIVWLEHDRPLGQLGAQFDRITRGDADDIDLPALPRRLRNIGERAHKAIDAMVERGGGRRTKPKANLDEILGPTPESMTSSAFSFGALPEAGATGQVPQPQPIPAPGPGGALAAPAQPAPMPPPVPRVSPPPGLKAPAPPTAPQVSPKASEEPHFRDVYDQYIAVRRQCGESTADVTFEKFTGTLRKNRDQILSQRPDVASVRFTVYVKDGRAALKANPVKA